MSLSGQIFSIVRASLHDGPGVRTVVYFKGCNLRCAWCHNPEGLDLRPQILMYPQRCIGCGRCMEICPEHHRLVDGEHAHVSEGCAGCGRCAQACPATAIELCGQNYTPEALMDVIRKDAHFYRRSGGGVSFSGGECLLQTDFLVEAARRCREEGIHVLLESCLNVPWPQVERAARAVDAFYVDVKHMDSQLHQRFTGAGNARILENIRSLSRIHPDVTLRVPLIPGANDGQENLEATLRFALSLNENIRGLVLLRYNPLAENKYRRTGRQYTAFGDAPQSVEYMEALCAKLNGLAEREGFVRYQQ